jgi:GMP synthase (glutamine-hydrolysing)
MRPDRRRAESRGRAREAIWEALDDRTPGYSRPISAWQTGSMRALAIVHERDAGPGVFADAMRTRDVDLETWLRAETDSPPREPGEYDAVLTFGGAMHVDHEDRHAWLSDEKTMLRDLLERETPLLGVCLGAQLLAEAAGARPRPASEPEIGWYEVEVMGEGADDALIGALAPHFEAFQWHSYESPLPPDSTPLARSPSCLQAYRVGDWAWGIQFHAEVTLEDAESWMDEFGSDEDAVRIGLDVDAFRERTRRAIAGWNELGRGLCERFIDAAAARVAPTRA